jgi:hypothetical protein
MSNSDSNYGGQQNSCNGLTSTNASMPSSSSSNDLDVPTLGVDFTDTKSAANNKSFNQRYKDLSGNLSSYEDYGQVAQYLSLDPEVFESHNQYSSDMNRLSLGPSSMSERSDSMDLNPFVGLRRINYQDVFANSSSRQTHSETPDQMPTQRPYVVGI